MKSFVSGTVLGNVSKLPFRSLRLEIKKQEGKMKRGWEKRLTRRFQYRIIMNKIFKLLDSEIWKIRLARIKEYDNVKDSYVGFTNPNTKEIFVDIRSNIIPTLIHESLHALLNDENEETGIGFDREENIVKMITKYLDTRMTERDIMRLHKFLMHKDRLLAKKFPLVYVSVPYKNRPYTLTQLLKS